jgi:uncharacterized protein
MITETQKEIVLRCMKPLQPCKVGIFGSFARGENSKESDLDILVYLDYTKKISLLDLIGVEQNISDTLGIKVDLVTEKSLHPLVRPFIEKEVTLIYE